MWNDADKILAQQDAKSLDLIKHLRAKGFTSPTLINYLAMRVIHLEEESEQVVAQYRTWLSTNRDASLEYDLLKKEIASLKAKLDHYKAIVIPDAI